MIREVFGTKIITFQSESQLEEIIKFAAEQISQGKLVAFPTDTVYGLGTNAFDQSAVEKIFQVKGRSWKKPLAILIADFRQVNLLRAEVTPVAQKLMERFWPGPLTLILKSSLPLSRINLNQSIGVRMPNSELVRKLITQAGCPIVATSANLSGHTSSISGEETIQELAGRIDLIIDAGVIVKGMESTVLDVTVFPPRLFRAGKLEAEEIIKVIGKLDYGTPERNNSKTKKILLVCTGNTCRSAIAEGLMKRMLSRRGIVGLEIISAGISATYGREPDPLAVLAMNEEDVNISSHRSRPLTLDLVQEADLILTMTESHRSYILSRMPQARSKVFLLKEFAGIEDGNPNINDPCGSSLGNYLSCAGEIKQSLLRAWDRILKWLEIQTPADL